MKKLLCLINRHDWRLHGLDASQHRKVLCCRGCGLRKQGARVNEAQAMLWHWLNEST